jgi:hypothetical protein
MLIARTAPFGRLGRILMSALAIGSLTSCGVVARSIRESSTGMATPGPRHAAWARAAWKYFETGRNPATGLVEVSAGAGFATPDTIADHLAAAVAARRLGLIDRREFDEHVSRILEFLASAQLSDGRLPARYYGTGDGKMIDPPRAGADPGWSAVATGRLLTWLRILADSQPFYARHVVGIVGRWRACDAVDGDGRLLRALPGEGGLQGGAEGGDPYAAYAALGFRAWGASVASPERPSGEFAIDVGGVSFPIAEDAASSVPVITAPYALTAVEFGWTAPGGQPLPFERDMAQRLSAAQAARTATSGIPTARTDFRRATEPYEVIDAVLAAGYPWSTTDRAGKALPALALTSTRAAFGLWAIGRLGDDDPTIEAVSTVFDPAAGWYEGRYESTGGFETTRTSGTNAFVLEAILHRQVGRLYEGRRPLPSIVDAGAGAGDCRLPDLRTDGALGISG